jgi:hypothetical protein
MALQIELLHFRGREGAFGAIGRSCFTSAVERARIRRYWAAAGFWSYWVGSLHEFVGWFLGRVPLDHLPSANITIDAAAVSNGQFGIAYEILRLAVPTDKVIAKGERWGAHRGIICAFPRHSSH